MQNRLWRCLHKLFNNLGLVRKTRIFEKALKFG
jgi:hypothetical protein